MADEGESSEKKTAASPIAIVIAVAFFFALAGFVYFMVWAPPTGTAKKAFANSFTCPSDRVELRARNDIRGSMFVSHPQPGAEISSDPARYAIWQKKEAEKDRDADSGGNYGVFYFDVRGCGHQVLYECSNKPRCSEVKYPAGVSSAW
jgi:hypothetical protein